MNYCLILLAVLITACNANKKTDEKKDIQQANPARIDSPVTRTDTPATTLPSAVTTTDLETFGALKLNQSYADVVGILGDPAAKSKAVLWEADGLLHQDWDYKSKGLMLNLAAEPMSPNKLTVFSITARSPCTIRTTRQIGIGSTYAETMAAYKGFIDESSTDNTLITVGTVYGGILLSFKNDKVETIFLGAAAE